MEENPCQDHLSNSQHSLALLTAGVNEVLLKASGITFSLALSAVPLVSYRDSAVTYTCIPVCGGGSFLGRAGAGTAANAPHPMSLVAVCHCPAPCSYALTNASFHLWSLAS